LSRRCLDLPEPEFIVGSSESRFVAAWLVAERHEHVACRHEAALSCAVNDEP
jgi:hypothetical protein